MHDIFYFTDIHGHLSLYNEIIHWCKEQDPECTIIYGGDACDRGEYGYAIMNMLLNDPQIIYLKGNHEDLFVKAARELIMLYTDNDKIHNCKTKEDITMIISQGNHEVNLHCYNGGYSTLRDWLLDGANEEFVNKIDKLPVTMVYDNIDFCHAGGTWSAFKEVNDAEYYCKIPNLNAINKCIWDRNAIAIGWKTDRICVHGHTPTIFLPASLYGRDKSEANSHPCAWQDHMGQKDSRNGWKIDMDTGAIFTNKAYVLNILTLIVYGFKNENNIIKCAFEQYKIINN